MPFKLQPELPFIRVWPDESVRVGNTRLLLVLVIGEYLRGSTPEQIVEVSPSVELADVYGTVAYYLRHRSEIDAYIEDYEREGEKNRDLVEAKWGSQICLRERLIVRRQAQLDSQEPTLAPPELESV